MHNISDVLPGHGNNEQAFPSGEKTETEDGMTGKYVQKSEEQIEMRDDGMDAKTIKKVSEFRALLPQVLAGSAKNLVLLDLGMAIGYSTIVIPELLKAKEGLMFTEQQASWYGSIVFICQPLGSIISGFLFEPIGRKRALIFVNFPHILGWFLTYFATSLTQLFVAYVILGIGIGFMEAPLITYVGEISQAKWRGTLIAYSSVFVNAGFTVIYFIGTLTDWQTAAAISSSIPMLAALCITQIPESPVWLIAKGRLKEAEKSLCWLRGWVEPELIQEEFRELVRHNDRSYASKKQEIKIKVISDSGLHEDHSTAVKKILKFLRLSDIFRRQTVQPLLLIIVLFFFHHFSGPSGTRPFMVPIFEDFKTPIDPNWATVIQSVLGLVATVISLLVIAKIGKRVLSHISFVGCALTNILICIYGFFFVDSGATWFPVTAYFALNFLWTFGLAQTPWLLVSEIFPMRGRGLASGLSAGSSYLFGFLVTKTYYDLQKGLTTAGVFGFYGAVTVIGAVLFYFYVPETEGKSLEEVEEIFDKKFNKKRSLSSQNTEINVESNQRF